MTSAECYNSFMDALMEKKESELQAFIAACNAGLPIVCERIDPSERPDLRVKTSSGIVGVEGLACTPFAEPSGI